MQRPIVLDRLQDGAAPATTRRLTLSEAQRAAFLLVKADGFTSAEAAKMLDIPVGTVKSQVHEALLRLRARLGDEETMPGKKAPAVVTKEVVTMTENDP